MNPNDCIFFFFHIPKTAGSSVHAVLRSWIPNVYRDDPTGPPLDLDRLPRPALIDGHFSGRLGDQPGALLERYPQIATRRDLQVITFLREPLAQAISYFHHLRRDGREAGDLDQFLSRGHDLQYSSIFPTPLGYAGFPADFFFCGVVEQMEESMRVLAVRMQRSFRPAPCVNVGSVVGQTAAADPALIARWRERWAPDTSIYQAAKAWLSERGTAWQDELDTGGAERKFVYFVDSAVRDAALDAELRRSTPLPVVSMAATLHEVAVVDRTRRVRARFGADEEIGIKVDFEIHDSAAGVEPALHIADERGQAVFSAGCLAECCVATKIPSGRHVVVAWIPAHLLNLGRFFVTISLSRACPVVRHVNARRVAFFSVIESTRPELSARGNWRSPFPGALRPKLVWEDEISPPNPGYGT